MSQTASLSAHLDPEVVEAGLGVGVLEQHELQGRIGDGEVRVAGLALGGLGGEELRVEVDRLVDVGDVEGELDSGHGVILRTGNLWTTVNVSTIVDGCNHLP